MPKNKTTTTKKATTKKATPKKATASTAKRKTADAPREFLRNDSGRTTSAWMGRVDDAQRERDRPPLGGDATCDVCVVGAGIAGLSVAYRMAKAGKKVVVLDDGPIAGGESGRTTGFLNTYPDDGLTRIAKRHDEETAKLVYESFVEAVDFIETVCRDEGIDAQFRRLDEYFFVHPDGDGQDFLDDEVELANRIGWNDLRFVERAPTPGADTGRCLLFPNQGQFHAGKYLSGLARAAERHGAIIYNNTHVEDMAGGDEAYAKTDEGHTVRCQWLVSCTNSPINPPITDLLQIHLRQYGWRSFVVALAVDEKAGVADAMYSDTLDPYHYARLETVGGESLLIVGGEDVKTGHEGSDDDEHFDKLEAWAKQHWPKVGARRYAWSGQVFEPDDYLALIGKDPGGEENSLICTGDSGQGLTNGTLAALVLGDKILGRVSPYATIYDPSRLAPKAVGTFLKDTASAVAQYAQLVTPGEVTSTDEIPAGSGAIIRRGLKKIAAYRDDAGTLHECSAFCTHLGGVVQWNAMERTWDCPVHSSRFAAEDGRCLTSPAISGLSQVDS